MSGYTNEIDAWPVVTAEQIQEVVEDDERTIQPFATVGCEGHCRRVSPHVLRGRQRALSKKGVFRHWQLVYECIVCGYRRIFGTMSK